VEFEPKHRYCDSCLHEFIKNQDGNQIARCRCCRAELDSRAVPKKNRYNFEKTVFWTVWIAGALAMNFGATFIGK